MAKILSGILGGFSGKIGGVIGGSWKGIDYMRSRPTSVANPNTVGQQGQRAKFSGSVIWAQQLLGSIIQVLWNPISARMSGYNYFMSKNIENFSTGGVPVYADIKTSIGVLLPIASFTATADASTDNISLLWTDNGGTGNALGADLSNIVVYNETQDYFKTYVGAGTRNGAGQVCSDTDMVTADVLHIYVSFNRDGFFAIASTPAYAQETVVP